MTEIVCPSRRVEDNVKYVENVGKKGKKEARRKISELKRMFSVESSDQSSNGDLSESFR